MPKISQLSEPESLKSLDSNLNPYENLFKEVYILDNWLRDFENKAEEAGILMTPVLIINGEIKHQGSVAALSQIEEWLLELNKKCNL